MTYVVLYVYWDTTEVRYAGQDEEKAKAIYKELPKRSREFQTWENGEEIASEGSF